MVSNLRGLIYAVDSSGRRFDLGEIRDDNHYTAAMSEYSPMLHLIWSSPLATMAYYERLRDGKEPSFYVAVSGELCFLKQCRATLRRFAQGPCQYRDRLRSSILLRRG